jgi:hypothetical protein
VCQGRTAKTYAEPQEDGVRNTAGEIKATITSDKDDVKVIRSLGSKDTYLHAVLLVSISQAKEFTSLALSLRVTTRRYGEVGGLVSGCGENFDPH